MTIKRGAHAAAYLILLVLAAGSVYLLAIGIPWTGYSEVQPGAAAPLVQTIYRPYLPTLYAMVALLPMAIGLARDEWLPLAWGGVLLLLVVGGLLIFSMGVFYLAATGLLAVAIGIVHWQARSQARWLLASAAGIALLLLMGALLLWTPLGIPLLVVGMLLAVLLVGLLAAGRAGRPGHFNVRG